MVSNVTFRKHQVRHARLFHCSKCDMKFGAKKDLLRHQRTIHGDGTPATWYCTHPGCKRQSKAFSRKDNLDKHLREVHLANNGQLQNVQSLTTSTTALSNKDKEVSGEESTTPYEED